MHILSEIVPYVRLVFILLGVVSIQGCGGLDEFVSGSPGTSLESARPDPTLYAGDEIPQPSVVLPVPSPRVPRSDMMGIQLHFGVPTEEIKELLDLVAYDLGFRWVKVQVDWGKVEYIPGHYSGYLDQLDDFMQESTERKLNVMLSVAKAPDWAREVQEEDGPPLSFQDYNRFVEFLIHRYSYRISAIEIWNEPNLRREWQGAQMSGYEYMRLLSGAFETAKRADPRITIISAGLAPTGTVSDLAVDDRLYLAQMYEAGLRDYSDAIGIHPYGWANPPHSKCCGDSGGVPSHNDHPSFYFVNTVEDYRNIQSQFGDIETKLWATEFGWGTMDGLGLEVPAEQPFFAYVTQAQQASYIVEAFQIGAGWDFMGPMVLWNLNVATLDGFDPNQAGYSILYGDFQRRPAFGALATLEKVQE